jgi:hypothetical protein
MLNVYKNQLSRQTGSRNLTGPKTLPTIGTLEIDSIGNSMKLIGTQLIIESGGVLIADFVDIEVNPRSSTNRK